MTTVRSSRILAVEIRAGRLGYAVFETSDKLHDFGAAWFDSHKAARTRVARLLRFFRPSVLVLRGISRRYVRKSRQRRAVARIARREAKKASISVRHITGQAFKAYLERHSCRDKYDIASHLAVRFPEIAWRLPPRPKFYDPEPRSILYFDSIALGAIYLEHRSENGV